MAQICTVIGMLVTIHSLGLIFASCFLHKWYVTDTEEIGVFGVCEYTIIKFNETNIFGDSAKFFKCYQLLWPDSDVANKYLSTKPIYLTAIMGVAIASTALGFLTLIWSFICVIFTTLGQHPRSCELLTSLAILTDLSIVATFGLFLGKDGRLYTLDYYGVSFWCSVGSAIGFFLTTILFSISRINTGFKYKLKYYQSEFNDYS